MPIELGAVLKLLGGAPHLKAGSFIAENLPIVKLLDGGQMSDLLAAVLRDGPGAVMQNPIAADAGRMQDAIEAAVDVLASTPGAAALVSAITGPAGLRGAVSGLSAAADLLSGVAMPGDGQFGLLDVATHTSVTDVLGDDMPATMGLDRVLGPLRAGPALTETAGALADAAAGVASGALGVADAVAWVGDQTAALAGVTAASATALQSAQDAALTIASISAVAATLAVPSDPALRAILPLILPADALAEMGRAAASHRA